MMLDTRRNATVSIVSCRVYRLVVLVFIRKFSATITEGVGPIRVLFAHFPILEAAKNVCLMLHNADKDYDVGVATDSVDTGQRYPLCSLLLSPLTDTIHQQ